MDVEKAFKNEDLVQNCVKEGAKRLHPPKWES
jgi:hypothetical protein